MSWLRAGWRRKLTTVSILATLTFAGCLSNSAPTSPEPAAIADWCAGHGLPESMCTKCNPALVATFQESGDWCTEHGFPESVCPDCNPATPPGGTAIADWCAEHGLPESMCTKCNSALVATFQESGDWCAEHGFPESVCPTCNPAEPPAGELPARGTRIRFRSADIERASGIVLEEARETSFDVGIECTARIEFDRNHFSDVRSAVPGIVREVLVDLGQEVARNRPLFVLESADVGHQQSDLRTARERVEVARANHDRQERLRREEIASVLQEELARQELDAAQAELRALEVGLRIAGASASETEGRFTLLAPIAGTIVRRPATLGTFATEEISLATIADTSTMWALLDIRESDVDSVHTGQDVALRVDGVADREFAGVVTWISSEVDTRTRTVAARAELHDPDQRLRAEQFARAVVRVASARDGVAVPRSAVQRIGEQSVLFVRTGPGVYEPRTVVLGRSDRDLVQVLGEIHAGDPVVTDGAFLLKTELSPDSIGAGCCEVLTTGGR